MSEEIPLLSIEYYHKLKELYHKYVIKSQFIYIYTKNSIVQHVLFKSRKNKYFKVEDVPHNKLLLSRDKVLPENVIVQVKFNPLEFNLFEG